MLQQQVRGPGRVQVDERDVLGLGDLADGDEGQPALPQACDVRIDGGGLDQDGAVDSQRVQRALPVLGGRHQDQRQAVRQRGTRRDRGDLHQEAQARRAGSDGERHRRQQGDHARPAGAQPLGGRVRPVAELQRHGVDPLARRRIDLTATVERLRDRRRRHAGRSRHIGDRRPLSLLRLHAMLLLPKQHRATQIDLHPF